MEEIDKQFSIYRRINVLVIKNNKTINISDDCLEINTLDFTPNINHEKDNYGQKIKDCLGIIGIITLEGDTYLITITEAKLICTISKKEIFKVLDTSFIKFTEKVEEENPDDKEKDKKDNIQNNSNDAIDNQDEEIIKQLKKKKKNGFYFSNKYV